MKTRRPLPDSERQARIDATDPKRDAWVSANAGSGKTRILRNRVIRLLLDGTPPDRILCLTYTRAAAAEMQGRIFSELARWVTLDDAGLDEAIGDLVVRDARTYRAGAGERAAARRLFARTIEAPGGLKVQTIHAFAERILHLFPIEAGVPLNFSIVMEDEAAALMQAARRGAIEAAVARPASGLGQAFGEILDAVSLASFEKGLSDALNALTRLALGDHPLPEAGSRAHRYRRVLDVPEGTTQAGIEAAFLDAFRAEELEGAASIVAGQPKPSARQIELAKALDAAAKTLRGDAPDVMTVLAPFVTADGTLKLKAGSTFTTGVLKAAPELEALDAAAREAVVRFREARNGFCAYTRSLAMLTFAQDVLARYTAAKRARSLLDFNDLIAALRRLLVSGHASWIMLKLDGSIDHVLIDEAQDTTREMWEIIAALTEEFFSGEGARRTVRTIFAVGDEKQSIYSFQGADPAVFEEYRQHFAQISPRGELVRRPVPLIYSFRSSDDVLGAVDAAFAPEDNRAGLSAGAGLLQHHSADLDFPGHVELWPPARAAEAEAQKGVFGLAETIARTIAQWLATPERHLVDGRPIRPGDILVLVRERKTFFHAVRGALKAAGVPVAGADQIILQNEIVVRDLLSLAQALLTPQDDLALAEALKSPVFGLDEAALEHLARNRPASLRAALAESPEVRHRTFAAWLDERAQEARVSAPFGFFARLLSAPAPAGTTPGHSLRATLADALGPDIDDPLNALLNEALGFEQENPGAVLPFVLAQRRKETTLKREAEAAADKVRVMTVHGAKGLEGRIVFLGDGHGKPNSQKESSAVVLKDARGVAYLLWSGARRADEPQPMQALRAKARETLMGEYRRLLYVGMTRASDRLYLVSDAKTLTKAECERGEELPDPEAPLEASWFQMLRRGLTHAEPFGETEELHPALPPRRKLRLSSGIPPAPAVDVVVEAPVSTSVPDWLHAPLPAETAPLWLTPSSGAAPGVRGGTATPFAQRRGIVLHKLFELLPRVAPAAREATGLRLVALLAPELEPEARAGFLAPVLGVLAGSVGQTHFGAISRAEVAISGHVALPAGGTHPVRGRIDRLSITPRQVDILDLKTGKPHAGAQDAAILRQMALYRALLMQLYPGHAVVCHILWLENAALETLPEAALNAAFAALAPPT